MARPLRGEIVRTPSPAEVDASAMLDYFGWVEDRHGVAFESYDDAWQWSINDVGRFWSSIWEYFDVVHSAPPTVALEGMTMPDVTWFPGAKLNYAENVLRWTGPEPAVIGWDETGRDTTITRDELRDLVARTAAGLKRLGVGPGDRVSGFLPNVPETLIAMLATASMGAIWSCCPPEYGSRSVLDRIQQVQPKVLIAVDGYQYRGRTHDRRQVVDEVRAALPDTAIVWVSRLDEPVPTWATPWDELLKDPAELYFEQVDFNHPLWILYSSGSTGLPKAIMHSHGGIVLEHSKSMALQIGIKEGTQAFQYTSSGWVMWNIHVGGLLVGATVLLYDGGADFPDIENLWRQAELRQIDAFGTSPAFMARCIALDFEPGKSFDLSSIQTIGSTGSPLPPEMYWWVTNSVSADVFLRSTSGGTDVCTSIMGCAPILPTRAGEIQCLPLGVAGAVFDDNGQTIVGMPGELVVTQPMPSMPVGLWGDDDRSRLRATYYDYFPGVWRHGDWVKIYEDGAGVVLGRSDATLNRGGIRIGTAELYEILEATPWIADCVVIDIPDDKQGGQMLALLSTVDGSMTSEAAAMLRKEIATQLSPRHVPDHLLVLPALPRTINGKRLEVPIKQVLMGKHATDVAARGAISDMAALEEIERRRDSLLQAPGDEISV